MNIRNFVKDSLKKYYQNSPWVWDRVLESIKSNFGNSTASGQYSVSEGVGTQTNNEAEHAEGKYNVSIQGITQHTVGIGTESEYKNAHLITTDGKHYIPGIGEYEGTETDVSDVDDVATVINSKADSGHTHSFSLITNRGEAFLEWGGKNLRAAFSPIDAALNHVLSANRLSCIKPEGVIIEYTNDGSTWTTYPATDDLKKALFTTSQSFIIGGPDSVTKSANSKLRITIDGVSGHVYTDLKKLLIYVTTNGSMADDTWGYPSITMETYDYNSSTLWHMVINKALVTGWSGWNVLNFDLPGSGSFGGTNNNTHLRKIRLTLEHTGLYSGYETRGIYISKIYGYGGVGWNTNGTIAANGVPYTYDINERLTIPGGVTSLNISGGLTKSTGNSDDSVWNTNGGTRSITESVTQNSKDLITSGGVQSAIAALGTPLRYKGKSTTSITDGGTENPTIGGTAISSKTAGDVVLYDNKEFVWTSGNTWEEFGDEGSYALKTISITGTGALEGGGTLEANRTITHSTSGVTAGNYGDSSNLTPGYGSTFKVPYITVNDTGHITSISTHTVKIPDSDNSNTATAADNILDGSNLGTLITYAPYTSQLSRLSFDTSSTNPSRTDRLNLNGYLYATKLYSGGNEVLTSASTRVTSVGLSAPTGFSVSGSPVTSSGTLTLNFASGYSLPTTAKQSNWDTAYGWGNHAGLYLSLSGGLMDNTNVVKNLNADLLDGTEKASLLTAASLSADGNNTKVTVTVGGTSKSGSVTVPYAGVSGSINDRALVTTSSGKSGANKWAKFGTLSFNHSEWELILEEYLIRGTETNFFSGILHITGRSGSTATTFDLLFLNWVALSDPDCENTVVAIKTGDNVYDLYIKSIKNYTLFRYNVLNSTGKIEFITTGLTWISKLPTPPSGDNSVIYSYLKSSAETVKLYSTSDNYNYRILLSGGDNDTTKSDTVNKSSSLLFNPSSKLLTVDSISTNLYNYKALKFATLEGYESTGWYKIGRFNKEIAGDSAIISIKLSKSNWAESYVFCISCTSPAPSLNLSAQINITQLNGLTGGWHKLQKIAIYKNNPELSGTEFELWMYVNYGTSTSSGGILSLNDYYIGVSNNFSSFIPITSISKDTSKTDSSFLQVLNTCLGIATTGQIITTSNLYSGTHLPNSNNNNLGTSSNKWNYVYADKYVLKTDSSWADAYCSIPFGVNGEPQSISYYKDTFNFNPGTDTLKSTNYLVKGGNIKVETSSSTSGCTMSYDSTEECMKFTFS